MEPSRKKFWKNSIRRNKIINKIDKFFHFRVSSSIRKKQSINVPTRHVGYLCVIVSTVSILDCLAKQILLFSTKENITWSIRDGSNCSFVKWKQAWKWWKFNWNSVFSAGDRTRWYHRVAEAKLEIFNSPEVENWSNQINLVQNTSKSCNIIYYFVYTFMNFVDNFSKGKTFEINSQMFTIICFHLQQVSLSSSTLFAFAKVITGVFSSESKVDGWRKWKSPRDSLGLVLHLIKFGDVSDEIDLLNKLSIIEFEFQCYSLFFAALFVARENASATAADCNLFAVYF